MISMALFALSVEDRLGQRFHRGLDAVGSVPLNARLE